MSVITTHVLDTVLGRPAAAVGVRLERFDEDLWLTIAESATDAEGRCRNLDANAPPGLYRLTFATGTYLKDQGRNTIYPKILVTFRCGTEPHYHMPLLLSDNGYTTYRGS